MTAQGGNTQDVPGISIPQLPDPSDHVRFPAAFGQRFILTVDAEEEFDWGRPLVREGHTLATVPALARFQRFCESHGVVPVYLMDYPVATAPEAAEALGEAIAAGRAEVGVQLHPWVNPPFDEELTEANSFAGNLPAALEREKFRRLRDAIEQRFGMAPKVYRAGRYGAGPNTAAMLAEAGIAVDTSVRALFDYSSVGGPSYRDHPRAPYWLDRDAGLFELPLTTVYTGPLRRLGPGLYPRLWREPRLRGLLAQAKLLERVPLTPEGVTAAEALRGIDVAVDEGLPVLVLSFHSPSIAPGHTPYVRDAADLDTLYDWWRNVFARLAARGVRATSMAELTATALASREAAG